MDRKEFAAWDKRVAERAERLWQDAGRPDGPRAGFLEEARELIAIAENPQSGTKDPDDAAKPVIEEASIVANLGEFASYSDRQGEEPMFPAPQPDDVRDRRKSGQ